MGILLGVSNYLHPESSFAKFLPLAEASEDGTVWAVRFDEAAREDRFPERGSVIWFDPPEAVRSGTVWFFAVDLSPSYNPSFDKRERYRVLPDTAKEPREVLDLPAFEENEEQLRAYLVESGVDRPAGAPAHCMLRWGCWWTVEPVEMHYQNATKRWRLPATWCQQHAIKWAEWGCDLHASEVVSRDGRHFLAPEARPQGTIRYMDWCAEYNLLADRVLSDWRKLDPDFEKQHAPARQAIREFAKYLSAHQEAHGDIALVQARLQRAENLLARAAGRQALRRKLDAEVIQPIRSEVREEERRIARQRAEAEVADVDRRREEIQGEVNRLQGEVARLRGEQEGLVGRLEESLIQRLKALRDKPETLLAEVALLRPMLDILARPPCAVPPPSPSAPRVPSTVAPLTDTAQLAEVLSGALWMWDVSPVLARPLYASFLAGAVPLLDGSRGWDALAAYAACVVGDRVIGVSIVPTLLDPTELLSRLEPFAAAAGDDLCLAILEGVNCAAVDAYLLPLLAGRGDVGRVPPNLLLAGLVNEGGVSLGLPPATWRYATLLQTDQLVGEARAENVYLHPDVREEAARKAPRYCVPPLMWQEWRRQCQTTHLPSIIELWGKAVSGPGDRGLRDLCLRFFAAARQWPKTTDAEACADTAAFCLVPLLAQDTQAPNRLGGGSPYRDVRLALQQAARLSG